MGYLRKISLLLLLIFIASESAFAEDQFVVLGGIGIRNKAEGYYEKQQKERLEDIKNHTVSENIFPRITDEQVRESRQRSTPGAPLADYMMGSDLIVRDEQGIQYNVDMSKLKVGQFFKLDQAKYNQYVKNYHENGVLIPGYPVTIDGKTYLFAHFHAGIMSRSELNRVFQQADYQKGIEYFNPEVNFVSTSVTSLGGAREDSSCSDNPVQPTTNSNSQRTSHFAANNINLNNPNIRITAEGRSLLKLFESSELIRDPQTGVMMCREYKCTSDVPTCGYGHAFHGGNPTRLMRIFSDKFKTIGNYQYCLTREDAEKLFDYDLYGGPGYSKSRVEKLKNILKSQGIYSVSMKEFEVLLSLSFNLGDISVAAPRMTEAFRRYKLLEGNSARAAEREDHLNIFIREFIDISDDSSGEVDPGLLKRRYYELSHLFEGTERGINYRNISMQIEAGGSQRDYYIRLAEEDEKKLNSDLDWYKTPWSPR